MNTDFGTSAGHSSKSAFTREAIHPLLLGHWPQLDPQDGEGVFVPRAARRATWAGCRSRGTRWWVSS